MASMGLSRNSPKFPILQEAINLKHETANFTPLVNQLQKAAASYTMAFMSCIYGTVYHDSKNTVIL